MDLVYLHFPLCKTISLSLHKSAFSKWMEGGQNTASQAGTLFLKWKLSGFKMNKSISLKKSWPNFVFMYEKKLIAEEKHTWFMGFLCQATEL